jgi:hypothetical protein
MRSNLNPQASRVIAVHRLNGAITYWFSARRCMDFLPDGGNASATVGSVSDGVNMR